MYCINCGKEIENNSAFCSECWAKQETQPKCVNEYNITPTDWKNSYFDGGLLGLIGVNLASFFLSLITIGLAWPAIYCYKMRWIYRHTVVGGYRLKFNGKGSQLFGKFIVWMLLTIVTATIYAWWLPIKIRKWETKHIEIDSMVPANQIHTITHKENNSEKTSSNFGTAIKLFFSNYANFSGRTTKSEYWWAFLFNFLIQTFTGVLSIIAFFAFLVPNIAITVRRLHDIGKSGWWSLLGLVPVVGGIILIVWFLKESTPDNQWGPYRSTSNSAVN